LKEQKDSKKRFQQQAGCDSQWTFLTRIMLGCLFRPRNGWALLALSILGKWLGLPCLGAATFGLSESVETLLHGRLVDFVNLNFRLAPAIVCSEIKRFFAPNIFRCVLLSSLITFSTDVLW